MLWALDWDELRWQPSKKLQLSFTDVQQPVTEKSEDQSVF